MIFYFSIGVSMKRWKEIKLSPFNKLWEYLKFYESDGFLSEFIDYIGFYWKRDHSRILTYLRNNNWACFYLSRRLVIFKIDKSAYFNCFVSVSLYWSPVNVCQLREIKVNGKMVLDVDLYGKWLKLIREEGLREELYLLFNYYLGMSEITLTRVDYTVDCLTRNFEKVNTLSNKVWAEFHKIENKHKIITGRYFWRARHDSARFLRYYDKKEDIKTKNLEDIYPEYSLLPFVMRYELQVNSKGLDDYERNLTIDKLYSFITLGLEVKSSEWKHLIKNKDWSNEELAIRCIKRLIKNKEYDSLEKIKLLLLWEEYLDYENSKCQNWIIEPLA